MFEGLGRKLSVTEREGLIKQFEKEFTENIYCGIYKYHINPRLKLSNEEITALSIEGIKITGTEGKYTAEWLKIEWE
ncbi:hypothetical protein DS832_07900 [Bombilactobacillus bombi]|uniref:Uncharacterized protein n=1 Tax=Bombilactobacillus bombi TaxID=1303590 RepID=A0A3R6V5X7_9LACO|nr:hypothetical protein [Bombilactobacillus bombi]RHW45287.1 hypothetical protein DS832_07900 [Bombilactobacillus bombi]